MFNFIRKLNFLLLSSFTFNHGHEFLSKKESIFTVSTFKIWQSLQKNKKDNYKWGH